MGKPTEFLAIGDVVIDAFIRLKDAHVNCRLDNEACEICMRWGDKIPYEFAEVVPAVGNAANAAVAAARLGLSSSLRAYVGDDMYATQCLAALEINKVSLDLIEKVKGKHTNYHYVLWFEAQRTILVKHETFEYKVPSLETPPQWIYLSSLGENSEPYHEEWMAWLGKHPEVKLAFQPGTYQIAFSQDKKDYWTDHADDFDNLYQRTNIFFCNKEEAERILGEKPGTEIKKLLKGIKDLGPKIVVITDDTRGSYSIDEEKTMRHCPRYPDPKAPYEITGAGDALASTTVAALALGKSLEEALLWGPVNASAVLQEIGAQKGLLSLDQLQKNLANPPGPYGLEKL